MTQEQKSKAYDEAYKVAEGIHRFSSNPAEIKRMEQIFPELKESEDERIRKHLIKHFRNKSKEDWNGVPVKSVLAWLEKQGEQKPAWSEEEEYRADAIAEIKDEPQKELAETYLTVFDKKFPILPTLRGKQLADYKNFLNKCQQIFGLKYWGIHPTQAKLFEKLSLLWAAWGAEHLQGLGQTDGDMDNEMSMWSEEDEENFRSVYLDVKSARQNTVNSLSGELKEQEQKRMDEVISWLKSLKERYTWKPSDEQMAALNAITVNGCISYTGQGQDLAILYTDLKKLRKE